MVEPVPFRASRRFRLHEIIFEAETLEGKMLASIVMIPGYGIIAVPTGIVSVELAGVKNMKVGTQVCPDCASEGHDEGAKYCKHCGAEM